MVSSEAHPVGIGHVATTADLKSVSRVLSRFEICRRYGFFLSGHTLTFIHEILVYMSSRGLSNWVLPLTPTELKSVPLRLAGFETWPWQGFFLLEHTLTSNWSSKSHFPLRPTSSRDILRYLTTGRHLAAWISRLQGCLSNPRCVTTVLVHNHERWCHFNFYKAIDNWIPPHLIIMSSPPKDNIAPRPPSKVEPTKVNTAPQQGTDLIR